MVVTLPTKVVFISALVLTLLLIATACGPGAVDVGFPAEPEAPAAEAPPADPAAVAPTPGGFLPWVHCGNYGWCFGRDTSKTPDAGVHTDAKERP